MSQALEVIDSNDELFGELLKFSPQDQAFLIAFCEKLEASKRALFLSSLQSLCFVKSANQSLTDFLQWLISISKNRADFSPLFLNESSDQPLAGDPNDLFLMRCYYDLFLYLNALHHPRTPLSAN